MKENKVSDKFFEDLDKVREVEGDYFKVVEMLEEMKRGDLTELELEWVEEMVGYSEEEEG